MRDVEIKRKASILRKMVKDVDDGKGIVGRLPYQLISDCENVQFCFYFLWFSFFFIIIIQTYTVQLHTFVLYACNDSNTLFCVTFVYAFLPLFFFFRIWNQNTQKMYMKRTSCAENYKNNFSSSFIVELLLMNVPNGVQMWSFNHSKKKENFHPF